MTTGSLKITGQALCGSAADAFELIASIDLVEYRLARTLNPANGDAAIIQNAIINIDRLILNNLPPANNRMYEIALRNAVLYSRAC